MYNHVPGTGAHRIHPTRPRVQADRKLYNPACELASLCVVALQNIPASATRVTIATTFFVIYDLVLLVGFVA